MWLMAGHFGGLHNGSAIMQTHIWARLFHISPHIKLSFLSACEKADLKNETIEAFIYKSLLKIHDA